LAIDCFKPPLILRNIATQLHLASTTLFQLLVIIGNKKHLNDFLKESLNPSVQEIIQADDFYAYRLAAQNGHHKKIAFFSTKISIESWFDRPF
jgi:hypothetical protein